ncbi:MAG: hypothetical protein MUE60_06645 [Candidatus Eisenbacteria bacterium]|nr:hypothetical protein [Candidatus Eisenbacteria bacterium]
MSGARSQKAVALSIILALAQGAWAQSLLLQTPPERVNLVGVRFLHPDLAHGPDASLTSGVYEFSVAFAVSSRSAVGITLPLVNSDPSDLESTRALGNLSLQFQKRTAGVGRRQSSFSIGITIPTADEENFWTLIYGWVTDYPWLHKYAAEVMTLSCGVQGQWPAFRTGSVRLDVGPHVMVPTGEGGDTEITLRYGLGLAAGSPVIQVLAEFVGYVWLTTESGPFEDRSTHCAAIGVVLPAGAIRPSLFYEKYLNGDLSEDVDGILGIKLQVATR